ncbi:MAG: alpha-galactosidase [Kiritimatiellae bacterium]|nr:alpha-galactosidase [Kiritimatiellia bacterium]
MDVAPGGGGLWALSSKGARGGLVFGAPLFEVDGREVTAAVRGFRHVAEKPVFEGVIERVYEGDVASLEGAALVLRLRLAEDSPVVRFRYELKAKGAAKFRLTKKSGRDRLVYLSADLSGRPKRTEVIMSEFCQAAHTYRLSERAVADAEFEDSLPFMGPILAAEGGGSTAVVAYEHGSQSPTAFIEFRGSPDSKVELRAVKGNYWRGREITAASPYETVWFDAAVVKGATGDAAAAFRTFLLRRCSPNRASRMPWIFYNTWAMQERDHWWRGSRRYLHTMNEKDILGELAAAHEMGVDVFVIDAGWFEKTGDWRVSRERFPNGLGPVVAKAKECGMKLGLWFSPTEAAVSSDIMKRNLACKVMFKGRETRKHAVWETEESQNLCLVSPYWKDFADELIRVHREWGVTYFKWDAIPQFWCDAAGHFHGGAMVPEQERFECAAFEQVRYMGRIVDRLCAECPDAIVDFDVTEGGRSVGLAFLASGKFFASNNGPYHPDLDRPYDWSNPPHWANVYVYPGPARARVARGPLDMDKWVPSVLFLTHFLPDPPESSQLINIGSLVLGQNGIWGELRRVPPEGRRLFAEALAAYKKVRDDITAASPVRTGRIGASPEIHEKISGGRGAVVIFSTDRGEHVYVTRAAAGPVLWIGGDATVEKDARGRAVIRAKFDRLNNAACAAVVFFGD